MRISDWSSDVCSSDLGPEALRLAALVELLYASGLRISELVGLRLAAAQRDQRLLIVQGKGGKERMVPLSPAARQSLTAYLAVRDRFLATRGPTGGKGARAVKVASPWLFPSRGAEGHLTRHRVAQLDRKSVVSGKSVSVRVDLGGRRIIKKK